MHTIHKYPVPTAGEFSVDMPLGARFLACQLQYVPEKDLRKPQMWFLVKTEARKETRFFKQVDTGQHIAASDALQMVHLATYQPQEDVVVHLFEHVGKH